MRLAVQDALNAVRDSGLAKLRPDKPRIAVGLGTCGAGNGAHDVFYALQDSLNNLGVEAHLTNVGCFGFCAQEPMVNVWIPGRPLVVLSRVTPADADEIAQTLGYGKLPTRKALCRIERWDHLTGELEYGRGLEATPAWNEVPFWARQARVVLRNCGLINPEDIEEYIAVGGYATLYKALREMTPIQVIEEVKRSKLRGRGGAGFPTGNKWEILHRVEAGRKVIICNADEGDPGAYMNRNEIESDPHSLLEGMLIGAHAMGAEQGVVYVRAEYPLAVVRMRRAIEQARDMGLLGTEILGTPFRFDVEVVEGAGAFVCGEETALIASLEGRPGRPRPRPPYPAQCGLWGQPTSINNVETWYNVTPIVAKGADWFNSIGTPSAAGTKVFSLVGKVANTGLVELPLGTPLKTLVYEIGGGSSSGKRVKAVQTGGPSGGCIPVEHFDAAMDYESLAGLGAIMGSGGVVVMDEDNCMADVARYFIEFSHSESCGQCVPCRVGLDHALRLLRAICDGQARPEDLATLEEIARTIRETSLCGLGQTAPNPVLTTLQYFRSEYLEHVEERRCRPTACEALFVSPCENSCPIHMNIPGYLALVSEGRLDDAALAIVLDNPLPASTGRVCQHPCESRCRRADIDDPVAIRDMHRFVVDAVLGDDERRRRLADRLVELKRPETGKAVAVVGSGPAGLTAAFYLTLLGHDVTVIDRAQTVGGMLRLSLPEYRLPKSVLDREIALIERVGVRFVLGRPLAGARDIEELEAHFDAVVLTVGTWAEVASGIPGADLPGVVTSIDFLRGAPGGPSAAGQKVIVIGGGNSAVDSARTAVRAGASVTLVYRRSRADMPAIAEETEAALAEGVEIRFLAIPRRIVGEAGGVRGLEVTKAALGEFDVFGRKVPAPTDETELIPGDTVVLAIGEKVDGELVRALGLRLGRGDRVEIDASGRTSRPKVYAAGDVVNGPTNVATAMGSGRRVAGGVDHALVGGDRLSSFRRHFDHTNVVPVEPGGGRRHVPPHRPVADRKDNFLEVVLRLADGDARDEAQRCLRCDVKAAADAGAAQLQEAP